MIRKGEETDDPVEDALFCAKSSPDRGGRHDASPWCVLSPGGGRCQRSAPNPPPQLASSESGSWELKHHQPSAGSGQNPKALRGRLQTGSYQRPGCCWHCRTRIYSSLDKAQPSLGLGVPLPTNGPTVCSLGVWDVPYEEMRWAWLPLPQPQGQSRFRHGEASISRGRQGCGKEERSGHHALFKCLWRQRCTWSLSRAGDGQVSHFTDEETEASWSDCLQVLLIRGGAWALASAQPPTLPPHSWHVGAGRLEMLLGLHLSGPPWWLSWERICLQCRRDRGSTPGSGKIPLEKGMVTHSIRTTPKRSLWREAFLPAEFPEPRTTLEPQQL